MLKPPHKGRSIISPMNNTAYIYKANVERVTDGDTFVAIVDLGFSVSTRIIFRVLDFDAPEISKPRNDGEKIHEMQAKAKAETLLSGKQVTIVSLM
jgi:endonuclease YncB( thermonuclease family)